VTDEIIGFLSQTNISKKNQERLVTLALSTDDAVARIAKAVLEVAKVHPRRRRRLKFLRERRKDLFNLLMETGVVEFNPYVHDELIDVDDFEYYADDPDRYLDDPGWSVDFEGYFVDFDGSVDDSACCANDLNYPDVYADDVNYFDVFADDLCSP
jgi:hypothetical protein